jgi:hypothetical protein
VQYTVVCGSDVGLLERPANRFLRPDLQIKALGARFAAALQLAHWTEACDPDKGIFKLTHIRAAQRAYAKSDGMGSIRIEV